MTFDARIDLPVGTIPPLYRGRVKVPLAPLRRAPAHTAPLDTQILFGHSFDVHRVNKAWAWGRTVSPINGSSVPGYIGYVPLAALSQTSQKPTHRVSGLKAPVFRAPDIKSAIRFLLPLNALVMSYEGGGSFYKIGRGLYVHHHHVRPINTPIKTDFVTIAEAHIGLPYVWGGVSSDGVDCSGLVLSSLRATGQDAPRDTDQQEKRLGQDRPTELMTLARGDLIFWKGHVGIMQSPTQLLHANAHHMMTASEPLAEAIDRIRARAGEVTSVRRII